MEPLFEMELPDIISIFPEISDGIIFVETLLLIITDPLDVDIVDPLDMSNEFDVFIDADIDIPPWMKTLPEFLPNKLSPPESKSETPALIPL